jgi:hypothetical protein
MCFVPVRTERASPRVNRLGDMGGDETLAVVASDHISSPRASCERHVGALTMS